VVRELLRDRLFHVKWIGPLENGNYAVSRRPRGAKTSVACENSPSQQESREKIGRVGWPHEVGGEGRVEHKGGGVNGKPGRFRKFKMGLGGISAPLTWRKKCKSYFEGEIGICEKECSGKRVGEWRLGGRGERQHKIGWVC